MKKLFLIIFSLLLTLNLFFFSCKQQGNPYIVWRKITNQMINSYGGFTFFRADPDSTLYSGIHTAQILAKIYGINDTVAIIAYGHVFSIDNPQPTLRESSADTRAVIKHDSIVLTASDTDFVFIDTLEGLVLDTSYYVRSFVIIRNLGGAIDTAYNQIISQFHTARPQDIWFVKRPFTMADARTEAVAFVINNKAYFGTGKNGLRLLNDFWHYDQNTDTWTNVANLPGPGRYKASAFVINDTAYVGLGLISMTDSTQFVGDFWKTYSMQFWQQIDSIDPTAERYDAVGFSAIYNHELKGFIAFGRSYGVRSDIYMYDPLLDVDSTLHGAWVNMGDIYPERYGAVAVTPPDKSFVVLGGGKNFSGYLSDFYIYYPTTGTKIKLEDFPGPPRYDGVGAYVQFNRGGTTHEMFYYGTGQNDTVYYNDWYAYDLTQDRWYVKSYIHEDFIVGKPRSGAVSFVVTKAEVEYGLNIRVFVMTGYDGHNYLNDVWEYLP